ncbi:hypothetical protein [Chishuiella sp.]|uniref:hypothetical protein n=1 Tax=Chishuiella sp. TaxID=1969467 RepID=UPI0028AE6549|nr:hypothetical protein [Chishuiella sp.]
MANIEGTLEEIYTYLGPRTSDIVTQLARKHRKNKRGNRISCGELNEDGDKCKKYTGLHAAHLKGRERKIIIQEILEEFAEKKTDSIFKMNLENFEVEFRKKHENFENTIQFMCPKHHKQYDLNNKVNDLDNIILLTDDKISLDDIILTFETKSKSIKSYLLASIPYLNDDNCSIARISGENWNFNPKLKKLKTDYFLLCYNQYDFNFTIVKIKGNQINLDPKKNKSKVSLMIPYTDSEFTEKKSNEILEVIDIYSLN